MIHPQVCGYPQNGNNRAHCYPYHPGRGQCQFFAHGNLMRAASGAYIGEADAVVLAPRREGRFNIVAVLDSEQ